MPGGLFETIKLSNAIDIVDSTVRNMDDLKRKIISKYLNSIKDEKVKNIALQKMVRDVPWTVRIIKKYESLKWREKPDFFPFFLWYRWYKKMQKRNWYLAIVDYSKPIQSKRCYLINMKDNSIEIATTCEQWIWKEGKKQPGFSNIDWSWQSSIGISQTEQENPTRNFWIRDSLVVSWKEYSNSMSAQRHILVHKWNVSHGCFVFKDRDKWMQIINKLKGFGTIFSYYPDANYLRTSQYV